VLSVLKTSSTLRPSPHPHDASSLTLYIHPLLLHHPKMVFPLICTSFIYTHCSVHCPSNVLFLFLYLFSYIHGVSFHPQFKPQCDGADLSKCSAATSAASRRHGVAAVCTGDAAAAPWEVVSEFLLIVCSPFLLYTAFFSFRHVLLCGVAFNMAAAVHCGCRP
jgi:hypothetical protein